MKSPSNLRVRWHLAALRFEHAILRHARALRNLKYDLSQPRVPAGNADGGQWTRSGGGLPSIDGSLDSGVGEAAGDVELDAAGADGPFSVNIDYSAALTGLSSVDNTTRELSHTLPRTMESVDFIPEWTPQLYGTAVHVAFGISVRLQGFPGIGPEDVEQSFVGRGDLDIYTGSYHKSGRLMFDEPGQGYGFPVPPSIRDRLIGNDRTYGA